MAALLFVAAIAVALLPFAREAGLVAARFLLVPQLLGDPAQTIFAIHSTTLRQTLAPDAWLGQINGSFRVLEVDAVIVGSLVAGWMGSAVGIRPTIWAAAVLVGLGGFVCLVSSRTPLPVMRLRSEIEQR